MFVFIKDAQGARRDAGFVRHPGDQEAPVSCPPRLEAQATNAPSGIRPSAPRESAPGKTATRRPEERASLLPRGRPALTAS